MDVDNIEKLKLQEEEVEKVDAGNDNNQDSNAQQGVGCSQITCLCGKFHIIAVKIEIFQIVQSRGIDSELKFHLLG